MKKNISSARLNESYIDIDHQSGLKILLYPMKNYKSTFGLIATKYGSIDTTYMNSNGKTIKNCIGIAHFLEHKMFESENGDAFDLFAKTGADSNAYTSADKTAFYFSCSKNYCQSLEILLNFLTTPYFADTTVKKEQEIIKQEIQMFVDNSDWQGYANLLKCMYYNPDISADIAGTSSSIHKITSEMLYDTYNAFYNLKNMVLVIAGNLEVEEVMEIADRILVKSDEFKTQKQYPIEPDKVKKKYCEISLPVAVDMFNIGFKQKISLQGVSIKNQIIDELLVEIIVGDITQLYKELYDEGLINQTFDGDTFTAGNNCAIIYSGESRNPKEVYARLCDRIDELQKNGIEKDVFELCKTAAYGKYISMFSRAESIATAMAHTHFIGCGIYDALEIAANLNYNEVCERLRDSISSKNSVLSVVHATEEEK
ncbi:MAG: pitrilysin family protein [Oscillospiraceae bacterium]